MLKLECVHPLNEIQKFTRERLDSNWGNDINSSNAKWTMVAVPNYIKYKATTLNAAPTSLAGEGRSLKCVTYLKYVTCYILPANIPSQQYMNPNISW